MPDNTIEIRGLERLQEAFKRFPRQVARNIGQAGEQSANRVILPTKGLQNYADATSANAPPMPYYERGRGMWTSANRNTGGSENMAKQWNVKRKGWTVRIGNRASYSEHVHGEKQAKHMASKGWRKLYEVAKEKTGAIQKVYNDWVAKTLRDLRL